MQHLLHTIFHIYATLQIVAGERKKAWRWSVEYVYTKPSSARECDLFFLVFFLHIFFSCVAVHMPKCQV